MAAKWKRLETLPDYPDCPENLLCWNPCDGYHLLWMPVSGPPEKVRRENAGIFTHWLDVRKLAPPPVDKVSDDRRKDDDKVVIFPGVRIERETAE